MAKRREAFGEAVFEIAVTEDSKLKSTMQASERIVKTSTDRMSKDFQKVSTAATNVQRPVASAGQVFGAFGAQASALGGTLGGLGGKVAALGSAFTGMGAALFGLPGLILGLTAAVGFLVSRMFEAKAKAKELTEAFKEMRETAIAGLAKRQTELNAGVAAMAQRRAQGDPIMSLQVARGIEARRLRDLETVLLRDRVTLLNKRAFLEFQLLTKVLENEKRSRMAVELDLAKRELVAIALRHHQIIELRQVNEKQTQAAIERIREANRKTELQKEAEQARKIADARQKAFQQQLERARATPLGKVLGTAFDIIRERREKGAIAGILDKIGKILPFGIGADVIEELRQRLGVGLQTVSAGRAGVTGFTPLSAFAQTGAGRPGVAPSASDDALRKQQERDRTIAAKATAAAVESIDRKTGRGSR